VASAVRVYRRRGGAAESRPEGRALNDLVTLARQRFCLCSAANSIVAVERGRRLGRRPLKLTK